MSGIVGAPSQTSVPVPVRGEWGKRRHCGLGWRQGCRAQQQAKGERDADILEDTTWGICIGLHLGDKTLPRSPRTETGVAVETRSNNDVESTIASMPYNKGLPSCLPIII